MKGDLHGLVAVVLAVGVVAVIVILALATVLHNGPITEEEATVLATIVGAVIGAVAAYMGFNRPDKTL